MALPINIQFTYSAENLQAANKLHYKKNYPFRGRILLWFGILLIWTGVLFMMMKGIEGHELMIYTFVAYGILVIGIHFYIMNTLGKRLFKKHKDHILPIDIEVAENFIRLTADDKTKTVKWNEILKATMNENITLLYISKMSFYIFPKENFKGNEFAEFTELIKKKVTETN
ncbi:MAG: YcxB family protein [Sphingobacteriales bacterium]|nr:MAG: YcxB family protein [Sphingobacteriales bacterium]